MNTVADSVQRSLRARVAERQESWRVPGLIGAVVRDGELAWSRGVGAADVTKPELPPDELTQYRIGSITKTFTAVLVMALRDEGKLSLDDRLTRFVPETKHASLTIRQMLAHASGLQREPGGDIWESLQCPDLEQLLAGLETSEQVLPAHRRWHYSNLAYAVLGEVVARLDGRSWEESLRARLLDPLGLKRTGLVAEPPVAIGYYPDPFTDQAHVESDLDLRALASCGGLWSTAADLGTWAAFLADPDEQVLSAASIEEMCQPQIMADLDAWTMAWGLGLQLMRRGERVFVGHTGGMPGHVSGVFVRRSDKVAGIALANTSAVADPGELALDLACTVLDDDPADPEPWRPGEGAPPELAGVPGRWWSEGSPFVFSVAAGRLEARTDPQPAGKAPAVFVREGEDLYRTESGREEGELLRLLRDESGAVVRMYWATYPFSREPETFGSG
jgi:CubicO group peptidase (beta-lactamase class C family)